MSRNWFLSIVVSIVVFRRERGSGMFVFYVEEIFKGIRSCCWFREDLRSLVVSVFRYYIVFNLEIL